MALVKFETDELLDYELESLKLSNAKLNTNSAAAKYAILNYLPELEAHHEARKEIVALKSRIARLEAILKLEMDTQYNKQRYVEEFLE